MNWGTIAPNLITGIVGIVGVGGTVFASLRSGKTAMKQARQSQEAEHVKWLRERRADAYLEAIRILHKTRTCYAQLERGDKRDRVEKLLTETGRRIIESADLSDLSARIYAFGTTKAYAAFHEATIADTQVFEAVNRELDKHRALHFDEGVTQTLLIYQSKQWAFLQIAAKELQTLDGGKS
jgi:hypothetical protein